jgi:hypothetical protein
MVFSTDIGWEASSPQPNAENGSGNLSSSYGVDELSAQFGAFGITSILPTHTTGAHGKKQLHLSDLPNEVIGKIVEHVALTDLDLTSLERLGMACKALYNYARDPLIWRMACIRVWGPQCTAHEYSGSWRQMYIHRSRPRFDGVYVSKSTYVRAGEKELNTFYAPCHVVEYVQAIWDR